MDERVYEFLNDDRMYTYVPCQSNCPVHTDVEGYIKLIAEGDFEGAHRLIRETNPFPSVCGRVCQHFCERGCNRQMMDKSVSIMMLKRAATDFAPEDPGLSQQTFNTLDTVGIIGAGPAGLTAAHDLAKMGYRCTVYETMPYPGGMMRYGIPAFRLPREIIDREVGFIERLGVKIKYNTRVGKDIAFNELKDKYKAILIAAGAHKPLFMKVPGEDLKGVYHGSTFMRMVNAHEELPPMEGMTVGVLGAGFTAMDVSRSCIRLGAKKVYIIYRRTRNEVPVNEKELIEVEEEGVEFRYLEGPVEVISKDGENVSGIKLIKNKLGEPDSSGRRRPEPIEGSEFVLDLDYIMPAISQAPEMDMVDKQSGLRLTNWGTLDADEKTFATNLPGIFVCGDFLTGTKDVINVIADGHRAAISIDAYLRGVNAEYEVTENFEKNENRGPEKVSMYDMIRRNYPETISLEKRATTFEEVERTFTMQDALEEASRCFQCGYIWAYESDSCILCMNCVDVCPQDCLSMKPISELEHNRLMNENISLKKQGLKGIEIDLELCIRCTFCLQVCPTDSIAFACIKKEKDNGILKPVLLEDKND
ncbi:MAG: FAD-dependent oxidoreductase [Nitrospinota bacterium]